MKYEYLYLEFQKILTQYHNKNYLKFKLPEFKLCYYIENSNKPKIKIIKCQTENPYCECKSNYYCLQLVDLNNELKSVFHSEEIIIYLEHCCYYANCNTIKQYLEEYDINEINQQLEEQLEIKILESL